MKRIFLVLTVCLIAAGAFSQDKMNKKMDNKSDKMNKKMESSDKMVKKVDTGMSKMDSKADTARKNTRSRVRKVISK